jgi:hypothetical protein
MTKPPFSSCIQFSRLHKPVVSFRLHSYGQLTDHRCYSLLKRDVLLSKRDQPHRHKDRHVWNNCQQQPSFSDFVLKMKTEDISQVSVISYTLILLMNGAHIRNNQTILCTLNIQSRLISKSRT